MENTYKIIKVMIKEVEKVINEQYKQGYEFVCFVPLDISVFRQQQILFKKMKRGV